MPALTGSDTPVLPPFSPGGIALLAELGSARDNIARRLVLDHHAIPDPDLNAAIVSSLLQALFLKTGEECGFVEPGTIAILASCDGIAGRMARACSDAGADPAALFEGRPGEPRAIPGIPDGPLRRFLVRIDAPDFPVPVARIPLEECAGVLEYFLGTRVQAAEGCRVNRAARSAMLYTGSIDIPPQQLIESIVRDATGPLPGATGRGGQEFRILDPACGAGLFLLAAYRLLARDRTGLGGPEATAGDYGDRAISSVFGTDIDPESVSAARFILLLAFLEEFRRSGRGILSPGRIRDIAPALGRSVRCGNALIAPDYFAGKPVFPFNAEERRRVNPFSWQEAFPEIIAAGGFDAVIGAPPPYRPFAVRAREEYFQTHYDAYAPSAGLYGYFIERGLSLLRPGGSLGFLVPGTFLRSRHARPLRRLILTRQIASIGKTGQARLLPEGEVPVYFLLLRNEPPAGLVVIATGPGGGTAPDSSGMHRFVIDQGQLDDGGWRLEDTREADLLGKLQAAGSPLDQYVLGQIENGIHRVRDNPRVVDGKTRNGLVRGAWRCRRFFVPLLSPAEIRRWLPVKPERFLIAASDPHALRKCRTLAEYLGQAKGSGPRGPGNECTEANPPAVSGDSPSARGYWHLVPKIIFAEYQQHPAFCYDTGGSLALTNGLVAILRNDRYLLALLNSSPGRFILTRTCPLTDRGYHLSPAGIGKFPVVTPDFDRLADKSRHKKIVALVTHILELNRYLAQAKTDQERRLVQQEIAATDVQIDALVYELYGLTPEEIAVVEGNPG